MNVMSPAAGHSVLTWDPVDELSTEQVREEFNALIGKQYLGHSSGKLLREFDPNAEEITMAPIVTAG